MSRFNAPTRNSGDGVPIATRIIRDTIRKGGAINEEVFKKIVDEKLSSRTSGAGYGSGMQMAGGMATKRRSDKAQKAIDMMLEGQKLKKNIQSRKEVVVVATRLPNGKVDTKGKIYDTAGNVVAKINKKNGNMVTISGEYLGKYKAKDYSTNNIMIDAINKHSPFLQNQRRLLQQKKQIEEEEASGVYKNHYSDWQFSKNDRDQSKSFGMGKAPYGFEDKDEKKNKTFYGYRSDSRSTYTPVEQGSSYGFFGKDYNDENEPIKKGGIFGSISDVFGSVSSAVWGSEGTVWGAAPVNIYGNEVTDFWGRKAVDFWGNPIHRSSWW